jgi:predicted nuclease of predicted toxin-antitoxin system
MSEASDTKIVAKARESGEVLITHDLDYGNLLAFSGETAPSIVILRLRNTHLDNLYARIANSWPQIEEALRSGAIVVLEDAAVRIRPLPVEQPG